MTQTAEAKLIAALKRVAEFGDVAPDTDHAPATMILRHMSVRGDLMRWDMEERRYFLTPRGYERIRSAPKETFALLPFSRAQRDTRRVG